MSVSFPFTYKLVVNVMFVVMKQCPGIVLRSTGKDHTRAEAQLRLAREGQVLSLTLLTPYNCMQN